MLLFNFFLSVRLELLSLHSSLLEGLFGGFDLGVGLLLRTVQLVLDNFLGLSELLLGLGFVLGGSLNLVEGFLGSVGSRSRLDEIIGRRRVLHDSSNGASLGSLQISLLFGILSLLLDVLLLEIDQFREVSNVLKVLNDALEDGVQTLEHAQLLLELGDDGNLGRNLLHPLGDTVCLLGREERVRLLGLLALLGLLDDLILEPLKSLLQLCHLLFGSFLVVDVALSISLSRFDLDLKMNHQA